MIYGYARVSTTEQDLTVQIEKLKAAGCHTVRGEKVSGSSTKGRVELATLLEFLREGDTLVVTRLDRLARSLADLMVLAERLQTMGVALKCTEQQVDTSDAAGRAFFQMLGVFAEFETALRKERQAEGIAKAKAEGRYKGRPRALNHEKIKRLHSDGVSVIAIAKQMGCSRSAVYKVLG
jgi:DNA invertase Pin-like site-specific DNA recombinase